MVKESTTRWSSDESLPRAIDAIYSCVTDVDGYGNLPSRLAPALRAEKVTQWCFDTDLNTKSFGNHGLDRAALEDYFLNWAERDTPLFEGLRNCIGRTGTPESLLGKNTYHNLPVFEGFYEPNGMVHQMGRFETVDPGWLVGIAAQRGTTDAAIDEEDIWRLELLMRHLRGAWRISKRLGLLSAKTNVAEQIVSECRLATWLVDGGGRLVSSNRRAEVLMCSPRGGVIHSGRQLRFRDRIADDAFRHALLRIKRGNRTPIELSLGAAARQEFSWSVVIPVDSSSASMEHVLTRNLLVVADSGQVADVRWQQLQKRLPISRTEADILAGLMRGLNPSVIAESRSSSLATIRSHEKSLRAKLGCHSRSALVATGWRTIAVIPRLNRG